jgi:hypothetical protein
MPDSGQNDILPLGKAQKKYENFLARMSEIGEHDVEFRPNCKFCQHPARIQGEEKWERSGGSYITVENFFNEYRKEHPECPPISYTNIKGHIEHHYKQQIKKLRIREYTHNLKYLLKEKVDQIETLDALSASLQMKYMDLASDTEIDSVRQADAQGKLAKIIVDIIKLKFELSGDLKPINLFVEKALNIFGTHLSTTSNNEVKEALMQVINSIEAEAGSIG